MPWTKFWASPPGWTLVTFNDYTLVPGALLYDFLPRPAAALVEAVAELMVGSGALGAAIGFAMAQADIVAWTGVMENTIPLFATNTGAAQSAGLQAMADIGELEAVA